MLDWILTIVVAVVQLFLGYLAFYVSVHPAQPHRRSWWKITFGIAALVAIGLTIVITYRGSAANQKLTNAIESQSMLLQAQGALMKVQAIQEKALADAQKQLSETQHSMDQKEHQISNQQAILTEQSRIITVLSKRNLDEITGGSSFAYVTPISNPPPNVDGLPLVAFNVGKTVMSEVKIKIREGLQLTPKMQADFLNSKLPVIDLGTLATNGGRLINYNIHPSLTETTAYVVDVFSRAGITEEVLQVRWNDNRRDWDISYTVSKDEKQLLKQSW